MKYLQPRATYVANHRLLEAVEAAIAPVPSPTTDKLKTMLEQRYPEFVRQLQSQAADPKLLAVIKAGMYDGDREDERIVFPDKPTAHYVRDLIPMQNEIDVDGSLRFQLSTTPEKNFGLDKIVAGEPITIVAPLVILNGKYVLDGHHRWSQTYAMNKDGQIVCFNFTTKASDIDPQQVLKAMQMAIAAITHEVATATVKGENLLRASEQAVLDYVTEGKGSTKAEFKGASDEAVRIVGVKHADVTDKASMAKYIWNNVRAMQTSNQPYGGSNAPERGVMPQTDGVIDSPVFKDLLNKGAINFLEPVARQKEQAPAAAPAKQETVAA